MSAGLSNPFIVAVPNLDSYPPKTGIGRVFQSIRNSWDSRIQLTDATLESYPLPFLRNNPYGVRIMANTDMILNPRLTGAQALRKTQGIPSVVIVHDVGIRDFPGDRIGLDWMTYWTIIRDFWGLQYASHLIAGSQFTKQRILKYLPDLTDRISVITFGAGTLFLEHTRDKRESSTALGKMADVITGSPVLIYVGSEIPRKNIKLLLQVFQRIKDSHPNAQLLKVGRPGQPRWRMDTLRIAESLGLRIGNDIVIIEDVDDRVLADLYGIADVFVSTSLYEGFGLPAVEAMAVGTPVVVTTCGSFPEVVGEVGWVVEPRLESFTQAVEQALADPWKSERVLKGRERAAQMNWAKAAQGFLEVVETICNGRSSSAMERI